METEKIYSILATKLGQTSLSERTIKGYVESFAPKEGEVTDEWYNQAVGFLKIANGQISHDIASQVEAFKKNYNPAPSNTNPDPAPAQDPAPKQNNEEVEALRKELAELTSAFKAQQVKGVEDSIRAAAISKGGSMEANSFLWEMAVKQTAVESGATADAFIEKVKPLYEAMQKQTFGDTAKPYGSSGNPTDAGSSEAMDAFFQSKGGPWAK